MSPFYAITPPMREWNVRAEVVAGEREK